MAQPKRNFYLTLLIGAFFSIFAYLNFRILYFVFSSYTWQEKISAFLLLLAECFILVHTFGYFVNIFSVIRQTSTNHLPPAQLPHYPPVAVVMASYKEPLDIIRDTLVCFYNLSYPNKYLYLLDDTRYELPWDTPENKEKYRKDVEKLCEELGVNLFRAEWHGAKAGKLNNFLKYLNGEIRPDYEFHPFQHKEKPEVEKYLLIFDADMNPLPDFVEELVWCLEQNPKAAFIQTPQYYTNFELNRVARAAGLQQAIFYEYICEGKGLKKAMFCCGTNVMFRREALMDVSGFDESSVTEDFATSLKLHLKGWESIYINRVSAFGLGPEDLGAYFKQQFRWARGTVGIFKEIFPLFIKNFNKMPLSAWMEYLLSCTHYFIGFAFLIMVISPILYLFYDFPSYFTTTSMYLITYTPYFLFSSLVFFLTLKQRSYRLVDLASAVLINAVAFPVYIHACISALLGIKTSFGVTPKGGSTNLSLRSLIPQIFTALLCLAAAAWGVMRLYYEREPFYALLVNIIWTLFNFFSISFFLYLNHAEELEES